MIAPFLTGSTCSCGRLIAVVDDLVRCGCGLVLDPARFLEGRPELAARLDRAGLLDPDRPPKRMRPPSFLESRPEPRITTGRNSDPSHSTRAESRAQVQGSASRGWRRGGGR